MIRWSYLVPRLILLAALAALVWVGLDPLLRWTLISLSQSVSTAKVDIGQVNARPASTEVSLRDIQVADARDPTRNLFEAEEIALGFETSSLLKRKFVVREGRIAGLRFGTERTTPGTLQRRNLLDLVPDDLAERLDPGQLVEFGRTWLERFVVLLKRNVTEEVEQLQSVRLARELSVRWPADLARMEARAEEMKARADRLRKLANSGSDDVVKNLQNAEKILTEVDSLLKDIAAFRSEVERLRDQAVRDSRSVVAAKDEDIRHIREQFRLDDLESGGLSEYLLGHELNQRVQTAARWIRWVRQHVPSKAPSTSPARARGVDVALAGLSSEPDFLIRSLSVEGEGQSEGKRFEFRGTAQGITSQPAVYGQPAVFHLEIRGPVAMQIEAVLDRSQKVARDYFTVECPALAQPKRLLGKPDQVAVTVSPGNARLSLRLELVGEEVSGRLSLRQEPIELKPELAAAYGGQEMANRLQDALREVHTLDATAELSGTLERPAWKLRSTLGDQLAQAFQRLLSRELETRREEVTQLIQSKVDEETARFEQMFAAKQQALLAKLQQSGVDVQQLRELSASHMPGLNRVLEKNLPADLKKALPADLEKTIPPDLKRALPVDLQKKSPVDIRFRF
jgi:uncharacterized protein (TIGR03545 family)